MTPRSRWWEGASGELSLALATPASIYSAPVAPVRVLGIATDGGGKWGQLYDALAERTDMVGFVRPVPAKPLRALAVLRNARNNLQEHKLDPTYSALMFDARSRIVRSELARRPPDDHDVIVQAQTLFTSAGDRPYVVYTDSTHALCRRYRYNADPTPGRAIPAEPAEAPWPTQPVDPPEPTPDPTEN